MSRKPKLYSIERDPVLRLDKNTINRENFLFDIVTERNSIPDKYAVIVNLYPFLSDRRFFSKNLHLEHSELVFPKNVSRDIANGKVTVIFSSGWESAYPIIKYEQTLPLIDFVKFSEIYNCPLDKIVYLIPNEISKSSFPVKHIVNNLSMLSIGARTWDTSYYKENFEKKVTQILAKTSTKYKGLLYARNPRLERLVVLSDLKEYELLEYFNFSLLNNIKNKQQAITQAQTLYNKNITCYVNTLKTPIYSTDNTLEFDSNQNFIEQVDWGHSLSSSFQVVIESYPDTTAFITEKSMKPFTMLQPIVVFGSAFTVKNLSPVVFRLYM